MPSIVQCQPKDRLMNLSLEPDDEARILSLPKYCCPFCNEITIYGVGQNISSPFTNEMKLAFDEAEAFRGDYWRGFTDFLCRVCHNPVRVVYRIGEVHMASFRYDAILVFELSSD